MKITHALTLTVLMSIFALSTRSEEYRAPRLDWKRKAIPKVKVAKESDFKDFEENSYKVEEEPVYQRDVASEEDTVEEEGRNPSSTAKPDPAGPELRPWLYK